MKKIFTTLFVFLACISAFATNVQLDIDDASRVKVQVYYNDYTVVNGINNIDVPQYGNISVNATDDAYLVSVTKTLGETTSDIYINGSSSCNIYVYDSDEGAVYKVTTVSKADAADSSMQIYVDNPAKVQAYISETYVYPTLVAGWQEFKFASAVEKNLQIKHQDYGSYLYQVKVNDEVVADQNGYYYITMADGMKLEIFADFPDKKVPVKVNIPEGLENIISSFKVNDVETTGYLEDGFQVQLGSKLYITLNTSDYALESFNVNGSPYNYYSYYQTVITDETTIDIAAHAYTMLNTTINVTDPSHIIVYKGDYYGNDIITLTGTSNEIQISEQVGKITICRANGCIIDELLIGEEVATPDYNGYYNINVKEGMVINVTSHAKERNELFVVYVDNADLAPYGNNIEFSDADRTKYTLKSGYNNIKLDAASDLPVKVAFWGANTCYAYLDGETWAPVYTGGTSFEASNIGNGSVGKFYFAGEPASCNVTFTVNGESKNVECIRDICVPTEFSDITVLAGTQFSFCICTEDTLIKVSANGEVVAENTDSASFTVNADTNFVIDVTSGIASINADNNGEKVVYNLQGIRMNNDYNTLPAGLYIVNGQKVLKK